MKKTEASRRDAGGAEGGALGLCLSAGSVYTSGLWPEHSHHADDGVFF